jgi:hypothetical protein
MGHQWKFPFHLLVVTVIEGRFKVIVTEGRFKLGATQEMMGNRWFIVFG